MVVDVAPSSSNIKSAIQREALPQDGTSPPSAFQIRIRTSAIDEFSITISWSQPMPVLRLAMARACASEMAMGVLRASSTTKSLPSPFILRKCKVMPPLYGKLWQKTKVHLVGTG